MFTRVKTASEVADMRRSGHMLATVLDYLRNYVQAGMTTKELADKAANELQKLGGKPAFLGYQGFPDVLCVSLNDEVVHGIPSTDRVIQSGDIVSLDFGVRYNGMITDGAISLIVDKALKSEHAELLRMTEQSLLDAINAIHNDIQIGDIGAVVEARLNDGHYGIVRDLVGHGVGHHLHEEPNIPNYGQIHTGPRLKQNMTVAIEPMATLGNDRVYIADDGWTVRTWDKSWAAHFEHTIRVDETEAEILTTIDQG